LNRNSCERFFRGEKILKNIKKLNQMLTLNENPT
jgi:hypothetical protein